MASQSLSQRRRHASASDNEDVSMQLKSVDHRRRSPSSQVDATVRGHHVLHLTLLHFCLFIIHICRPCRTGVVIPIGSTPNVLATPLIIGLQTFYTVPAGADFNDTFTYTTILLTLTQ